MHFLENVFFIYTDATEETPNRSALSLKMIHKTIILSQACSYQIELRHDTDKSTVFQYIKSVSVAIESQFWNGFDFIANSFQAIEKFKQWNEICSVFGSFVVFGRLLRQFSDHYHLGKCYRTHIGHQEHRCEINNSSNQKLHIHLPRGKLNNQKRIQKYSE